MSEKTIIELQRDSARLQSAIGETEMRLADLKAGLVLVCQELAKRLKPASEPKVSDHALLRYIERIMEIDIEAIRASILTDAVKGALNAGATGVTVNGVKFVSNGERVLVTVLSEGMRPKKKTRRGWRDLDDMPEQIDDVA
jgi:hypothetical protein